MIKTRFKTCSVSSVSLSLAFQSSQVLISSQPFANWVFAASRRNIGCATTWTSVRTRNYRTTARKDNCSDRSRMTYDSEKAVAISAVRRACGLTSSVFNRLVQGEKLVKGDKSPVTVGDFSAQALISTILHNVFPEDPIVGEEDASDLRHDTPEATLLRERVVSLANEALTAPLIPLFPSSDGEAVIEDASWGIGPSHHQSPTQLLDAIDRGNHEGGRKGRMWCIDPIDGTKGFLRGEQYAVCLALIVDGEVKVGVIGCPNLPVGEEGGSKGCISYAVRGEGAWQIPFVSDSNSSAPKPTRISITPSSSSTAAGPSAIVFLESVESAHSSHSTASRIADVLRAGSGGVDVSEPIRMDSQAKYCVLARGRYDSPTSTSTQPNLVYLRLPTTGLGPSATYIEKIWDHAPGSLLIEEAGGVVTDSRGEKLDFGLGRTLGDNWGVVAAGKDVHGKVLGGVKRVLFGDSEGNEKARV
ncbi:hypothetical protein D9758_005763 [Tetrapyrgos nigripes]|uniref:3'(2'),5'-bisphosphate nucleotidase n=1 Tax=Tetrapyrgos nigripes TaxID=182062 RepID=A0A8H5LQY4_9AGAR|nr:hypothetical protein D9758_005763 [Tetrapyrgos nigripes]